MRKWRVVSAEGWGPGFSGANCTFRITSRTEFLGVRVYPLDTQTATPTSHRGWGSWEQGWNGQTTGEVASLTFYGFSLLVIWHRRLGSQSLRHRPRGGGKVRSCTRPPPSPAPPLPSFLLPQSWAGTLAPSWSEEQRAWPSLILCLLKAWRLAEASSWLCKVSSYTQVHAGQEQEAGSHMRSDHPKHSHVHWEQYSTLYPIPSP